MKHLLQNLIKNKLFLFLLLLTSQLSFAQTTTPIVGVPTYYNGQASGNTNPGFVTVFYNPGQGASSLSSGASSITVLANGEHIGATWGTAYDPRINTFYTGAVQKRHVGFASTPGTIYKINAANTTPGASVLIDLNGKTGTLPGGGTSAVIDCGNAATDHGALFDLFSPSADDISFSLAGKSSLGDIDISPTSNTLWVINAKQRQLISVNITNPSTPTVDKVFPINATSTGVTAVDGELRPWGIEVSNSDDVYIGLVATAENVTPAAPTTTGPFDANSTTTRENPTNRAKLIGYVFKLNKATGAFTQMISFPLNYSRPPVGLGGPIFGPTNIPLWVPWFEDYTLGFPNLGQGNYQFYPQPLISDIEIMDDGSMLVAIMDRFGLQTGSEGNTKPSGNAGAENGRACGDVVRFISSGTNTWNNTINNFYGDNMSFFENEAALGSIAYKSGTSEFIGTAVDAAGASSNGLAVMGLTGTMIDNQDLISNGTPTGIPFSGLLASKGNALGDVEIGFVGPQVCINPILYSAQEQVGTCSGLTANNNGAIVLNSVAAGDRVGYVIGNSYTGGVAYSLASPINTLPFNLVSNIPNAGTTYTIRVFNGSDLCFKDTTITTTVVFCGPPPPMATVGNYVWNDFNSNGLNDENPSAGINGVLVELWKETTPGSGVYAFYATKTTANDGSGNPGYYNFDVPLAANFRMKFPTTIGTNTLTTQTITAATDNNSDANPTSGFSETFVIDPLGTGFVKDNPTLDAGFICNNGLTVSNFSILPNQSVTAGQGLVYSGGASCTGTGTFTYSIPINIPNTPVYAGSTSYPIGTATMSALPPGAVITSANVVVPNITPQGASSQFQVRIDLTGAVTTTPSLPTIGAVANNSTFTYTNNITTASVNASGGLINVIYREAFDVIPGQVDAVFGTGTPAPGAFINITYTAPNSIGWYTTITGGSPIATGNIFNPVGVLNSGITNTATLGTTTYFVGCSSGGCRKAVTFSVQNSLPVYMERLAVTENNCKVNLNWHSGTEVDFKHYEVEYSKDGLNFNTIAKILGKGSSRSYVYTMPDFGRSYFKLKLVSLDGTYKYSNIVNTNDVCANSAITIYPNPIIDFININVGSKMGKVNVQIQDSYGYIIINQELQNGLNRINTLNIAAGVYFVKIYNSKGIIEQRKINVTR